MPLRSRKLSLDEVRALFDEAYREFHSLYHRTQDPVHFAHHFEDALDQEIVAFLSALLAYGNVKAMLSALRVVLAGLGRRPRRTLEAGSWSFPASFRYRFTTAQDLHLVCLRLSFLVRRHGSIESAFSSSGNASVDRPSLQRQMALFVERFHSVSLPPAEAAYAKVRERALRHLVSDPLKGSSCKRLNLYLRWMVRPDDGIDLGIWKEFSAEDLVLPVDTHILKLLRRIRWTKSKTATWQVADEATARLKVFCPEDPVKYDFALCHMGMNPGWLEARL